MFRSKPTDSQVLATIRSVWESADDEEYRQSQSHWRGVGRWKDDGRWQAVGKLVRQRCDLAWAMAGRTRPKPLTVLEWGSGGGCIAFAFRDVASKYFGVDISEKNLAECGRMLSAAGHSGLFCPVALSGEPHSIIEHVSQPIDLFISNAVFQHFPSREYGVSVLRAVRRLAGPGCVGAVQIRYDNGRRLYRGITRLSQYAKRHIVATSYPIEEFWRLLIETGWEPIGITRILAKNNEADFVFRAC